MSDGRLQAIGEVVVSMNAVAPALREYMIVAFAVIYLFAMVRMRTAVDMHLPRCHGACKYVYYWHTGTVLD